MRSHPDIMILLHFGISFLVISLLSLSDGSTPPKSKRQIYREQVLPSRGGKIPDAAFHTDRLALNRLNKEGISIPDGVLLEHRHVHSHPHINQHDPEDEDSVIKIVQRPENRFVAPEGKPQNNGPLAVSSTYLIRKPIGPEGSAIRIPQDQVPIYETLNHKQGNQIYQTYPEVYYQQSYTRQYAPPKYSQKYLPAELTAPPQKYLPLEIPPPSKKYLPTAITAPPKYIPSGPTATIVHHPHPYGYKPSVSYQQLHQTVAYYPITVPFQLPNKETLKDEYYVAKNQGNTYGSQRDSEDIHSVINWPYLLRQYTQLADKINALEQESYGPSTPHSVFFTPEVLGPIDSGLRYYTTRDRYARKSKEIAFTETAQEPGKSSLKNGRRLIKLKCTNRLENTVEDGSSQCFIRY